MGTLFTELLSPINLLFCLFAYGLGAVPTSYWVARILHGIDLRHGHEPSHTASFLFRNISKTSGVLVYVLDFLKGLLPCAIALSLEASLATLVLVGFFAVLGHCFSIWLRFFGGHGGATFAGAMLMVFWPSTLAMMVLNLLASSRGFSVGLANVVASVMGASLVFFFIANKVVWLLVVATVGVIVIRYRKQQ